MNNNLKNQSKNPLVSIVTVVLNDVNNIEQTICSVIEQTYKNIEYIIIDGRSNDGTIKIIKKYQNKIKNWISEPDKGIYDAMNKGIVLSNGDYIYFLNSGDKFYNNEVTADILKKVSSECKEADFIYGNLMLANSEIFKPLPFENLWKTMTFGHPTLFVKNSLMKKFKFDLKYKISADYDFVAKCYSEKKYKFFNTNLIISCYKGEGKSSNVNLRLLLENWLIARKINNSFEANKHHVRIIYYNLIDSLLKKTNNLYLIKFFDKSLRYLVRKLRFSRKK